MRNRIPARFTDIRILRESNISITFVAKDNGLDRPNVVAKIIRKGHFDRHAATLQQTFSWFRSVVHPQITTVLDAGLTLKDDLFFVREYLEASEFFAHDSSDAIRNLISCVAFLHAQARIHGAIKPSNLFMKSGGLKLTDPLIQLRTSYTSEEDIRYTAPEVLAGTEPTIEADLYAVGALVFRAFAGRDPFDDTDLDRLRAKYLCASPRPLADLCYVSAKISDLTGQLLGTDRSRRMKAFSALREELHGQPIQARRAAFIGRESAFLQMETGTKQSVQSNGLRGFLIEGEPGIGKSRFIEAWSIRTVFDHREFVRCACSARDKDFAPLIRGVREFLKRRPTMSEWLEPFLKGSAPALAGYLGATTQTPTPVVSHAVERVAAEFVRLIACMARRMHIAIAIDDIQHIDPGTERVLKQLVFRSAEIPAHLILTHRMSIRSSKIVALVTECLSEKFVRIRLTPLTDAESRCVLAFLLPCTERRETVLQVSAGNPRFLEAFSGDHTATAAVMQVKEATSWTLSQTSTESRPVLECLSLFSRPISIDILAAIRSTKSSDLEKYLGHLESFGIIDKKPHGVMIRHPNVRTKIYNSLKRRRRVLLNKEAFHVLYDRHFDSRDLAHHSYEARMFQESGTLFLQLAREAYENQQFNVALSSFKRAAECAKRGGPQFDSWDEVNLANSYKWTGNQKHATRLYSRLLSNGTVKKDPEALSFLYANLGRDLKKKNPSERLRLYQLALDILPVESPLRCRRLCQLSQAYLTVGNFAIATSTLDKAEQLPKQEHDVERVSFVRACLAGNFGDFKRALNWSKTTAHLKDQATVLNNRAYYLENLGHLRNAREIQLKAQQLAISGGFVPAQIMALESLGALALKLGNMSEAENYLQQAISWIRQLKSRDRSLDTSSFESVYGDLAFYYMQTGKYGRSAECLSKVKPSLGSTYESDRVFNDLAYCAFYLRLGLKHKVIALLRRLNESPTSSSLFFQVERILVEVQLPDFSDQQRVEKLERALSMTQKIDSLYQRCRIENQLANVLLSLDRKPIAFRHAKNSLSRARRKGYALLAVEALILLGRSTPRPHDQQDTLTRAVQEASELGLAESTGEAAYYLGCVQLKAGKYVTAHENLMKSHIIIMDVAEDIPARLRSAYLSFSWRRDVREILEKCKAQLQIPVQRAIETKQSKDDLYFRAVYRLTFSATSHKTDESLAKCLLDAVQSTLDRPVVLTLEGGGRILETSGCALSSELTDRVELTRRTANGRMYFGSLDKKTIESTVAWVPLKSERHDGGIYVACHIGDSPFSEREMEFLTVVGTIGNAALQQRETHPGQATIRPETMHFHGLVGASKTIREVYSQIEIAAGNAATVLIEGESGTGKELVARAIHQAGARAKEAFIAVDCGAIPESLIEAELFGAKKGSYTGAVADRPGLFEAAHRGTIFLDEISNTTPALQAKLLRVIQQREVRRIGETKDRPIDVRVIVASNSNLETLAQDGRFRKDLLYRLKVLHIKVPPLRSRTDDIPMLAHSSLEKLNASNNTKKYFGAGVISRVATHAFPGNVRELQNAIERAYFSARGMMITDLPLEWKPTEAIASHDEIQTWFKDLSEGRKDFWAAVHNRYKRRDISRERVLALVDLGLRSTHGNYKTLAATFRLKEKDYRRFMDFLRRNDCMLDFRPYRKSASAE